MNRKMCVYCAKWKPDEEMWQLLGLSYCSRCYPIVYENVRDMPWNKGKPSSEWK